MTFYETINLRLRNSSRSGLCGASDFFQPASKGVKWNGLNIVLFFEIVARYLDPFRYFGIAVQEQMQAFQFTGGTGLDLYGSYSLAVLN